MSGFPGKSLVVHLWNEDTDDYKTLHKDNSTTVALCCPRANISNACAIGIESGVNPWNFPGVYLLVGGAAVGSSLPEVYVGEADCLKDRIKNHLTSAHKDFWHTLYACTSPGFNKATVQLFEAELIKMLRVSGTVALKNGTQPTAPHLGLLAMNSALEHMDDVLLYLQVLGATWLKPAAQVVPVTPLKNKAAAGAKRAACAIPSSPPPVLTSGYAVDPGSRQAVFFKGKWYPTMTAGETVGKLLNFLEQKQPGFLNKLALTSKSKTKKRQFLAKNKKDLYVSKGQDFAERHSRDIGNGWWLGFNYSSDRMYKFARQAVALAGEDWQNTARVRLGINP